MLGNWLAQVGTITAMNLRNVRERLGPTIVALVGVAGVVTVVVGVLSINEGFRDVLGRLMRGQRIGSATDNFNLRWAGLSAELAEVMVDARQGHPVDMDKLAMAWVARDDARNYIVLGDPAVRLRVEDMPELA